MTSWEALVPTESNWPPPVVWTSGPLTTTLPPSWTTVFVCIQLPLPRQLPLPLPRQLPLQLPRQFRLPRQLRPQRVSVSVGVSVRVSVIVRVRFRVYGHRYFALG